MNGEFRVNMVKGILAYQTRVSVCLCLQSNTQVAVMLNDLGTALSGEGKLTEAEEVIMKALAVAKLNLSVTEIDQHLAIIQCNLAEVQTYLGTL